MDWLVGNFENGKDFLGRNYDALEYGEGFWTAYKRTGNITVKTEKGEGCKIVSGQAFGAIEEGIESDKELGTRCLRSDGSFVKVSVKRDSVRVVTDFGGSVPVFYGYGPKGFAIGTLVHHVAALSGLTDLDKVSAADYLINGVICYPYSWYEQVREVKPGSVSTFKPEGEVNTHTYWQPTEPDNPHESCDAEEWGNRLREQIEGAIQKGIEGKSYGRISYSGGIDSRSVLSLVPDTFECTPTIVLDSKNKEYWAAKHSARLMGRKIDLVSRPENHYRTSVRDRIDTIGPGWDFRHTHIFGVISKYLRDSDVILGGFLVDGLFKTWGLSNVRGRRFRPNELGNQGSDVVPRSEDMALPALWNDYAAVALERRRRHHEKLKSIRPRTAGTWHGLYPLSNDPHYSHHLTNLRIGPSILEPFTFNRTYRLASQMPETGRLENTVLRHAFSNEMGLAGWWPTSRGVLPRLGDQYLGYLLGFAVRRWFDVRGTYDETFQSGSWPADQSGWSPVHPEEHFSSQECELLMDRVTDLFSEEGKRLFRHERVSDATKVQALALAFDVTL